MLCAPYVQYISQRRGATRLRLHRASWLSTASCRFHVARVGYSSAQFRVVRTTWHSYNPIPLWDLHKQWLTDGASSYLSRQSFDRQQDQFSSSFIDNNHRNYNSRDTNTCNGIKYAGTGNID